MQKYNTIIYNKSIKIKPTALLHNDIKLCIDKNIDAINQRNLKSIKCKYKYKSLYIIGRPLKPNIHFTRSELNEIRDTLLKNSKNIE